MGNLMTVEKSSAMGKTYCAMGFEIPLSLFRLSNHLMDGEGLYIRVPPEIRQLLRDASNEITQLIEEALSDLDDEIKIALMHDHNSIAISFEKEWNEIDTIQAIKKIEEVLQTFFFPPSTRTAPNARLTD